MTSKQYKIRFRIQTILDYCRRARKLEKFAIRNVNLELVAQAVYTLKANQRRLLEIREGT